VSDGIYVLKHRENDIAEFKVEKISNNVDYLKIFDEEFSPVNSKESEGSQLVSFNGWLTNRCMPNSRDGIERLKKKYKLDSIKEIMFLLYGLSLSDHYWIDREPFNNKWKDINLFENRYSETIGKILFDKKIKLVNDIADTLKEFGNRNPDITTGGSLKKYWKYNEKDNKSYLIKGGSRPDLQEPFNEYYAHLLLNELKFKHTPYHLEKDGDEYASVCPCIADINNEMISAVDIQRKYRIEKNYEGFVGLGKKNGCVNFQDDVNQMLVLDYLIDNIDRHWNNFGILRNSQTGSWAGLIPVFDNGYSLWNKDFVDSRILSESMSFANSNEECVKMININNYVRELPDLVEIFDEAFGLYGNTDRKDAIRKGLRERMDIIKNFMEAELVLKGVM